MLSLRSLVGNVLVIIILMILFSDALISFFPALHFINNLDDALLAFAFAATCVRAIGRRIERFEIGAIFFFFAIASYGLLVRYAAPLPVIAQSLIHLKLIFYVSFLVWAAEKRVFNPRRVLLLIGVITLLGFLWNLSIDRLAFNRMLSAVDKTRFDQVRLVGLQASPINLGLTFGLFFVYITAGRFKRSFVVFAASTVFLVLICYLSGSRSPLAVVPLTLLCLGVKRALSRSLALTGAAVMMLFVLLVGNFGSFAGAFGEAIETTSRNIGSVVDESADDEHYIRGMMLVGGLDIAKQRFPFGYGPATYGTVFSSGSPAYAVVGLENTQFVENLRGVFDSNLASLLGELGVLGSVLMYLLVLACFLAIRKKSAQPQITMTLMLMVFFYSVVGPVLQSSYAALAVATVVAATIHSSPRVRRGYEWEKVSSRHAFIQNSFHIQS